MFPLVAEIPQAVRSQEFLDFLRDVLVVTGDIDSPEDPAVDVPELTEAGDLLFQHILRLNDEHLIQAAVDQLRSDRRLLLAALLGTPSLTALFARDHHFVRKLWHDLLPFKPEQYWFKPISRSLGVVAFMLRNALIPEAQRDEVIKHVVGKIDDSYPHQEYDDEVLDALAPFGFWDAVHRRACDYDPNARWLAHNLWLCVDYITRFPLDADLVRKFAALVPEGTEINEPYHRGSNFDEPEDAYDLAYYFEQNPEKLDELVRVAAENEIDVSRFVAVIRWHQNPDETQ